MFYSLVLQALELQADAGKCEWVMAVVTAMLPKLKKRTDEEALRRRVGLQLLGFRCRLQLNMVDGLTATEERTIFGAWPCSLRAWNLFSQCAYNH